MSDFRKQLVERREQQLADLRERTGIFERFTLDYACAAKDQDYRVVFVKRPGAAKYVREKVKKGGPAPLLGKLQDAVSLARSKRFMAEEAELDGPCDCCGAIGVTLCNRCGSFVCDARSNGNHFRCRPSCGKEFISAPLKDFSAGAGNGSGNTPALSHQGLKRLTKR